MRLNSALMPLIPDLRRALFFFWLTFLFCAQPAWATGANLVSFKKAYPAAKGISCKTCHQNPVGRTDDLNDYGLALRKFKAPAKAASLKVEDYRALEAQGTFPPGLGADSAQKKSSWQLRQEEKSSLIAWLDRLGGDSAWAQTEKAEYVGSESCAACHGQISSDFKHATHSRISIPDNQVHGCEMCHGPASLHVAAGGGRGVGGLVNPSKDPSACFACHMEKKAEFRLPFHHPVLEGKMSCASCHEPHQEEIRPWTSTSMEGINEACFKCHKEQRGPFAWEHEALREGCTTCHKVHGSIHDKMLVARDNNLCLRCHTQVVFPTIGRQSHSGRLPQGTCFSAGCHTAVHGSNFDDHLRY